VLARGATPWNPRRPTVALPICSHAQCCDTQRQPFGMMLV
jgi:hypothetical protein